MEFALALPLILGLLLWLLSSSFMFYSQGAVAAAAREAARHIAIHGETGVNQVIDSNLALVIPGFTSPQHQVTRDGDIVRVRLSVQYTPFVDFNSIIGILGGTGTSAPPVLSGVAYFRNERPGP